MTSDFTDDLDDDRAIMDHELTRRNFSESDRRREDWPARQERFADIHREDGEGPHRGPGAQPQMHPPTEDETVDRTAPRLPKPPIRRLN